MCKSIFWDNEKLAPVIITYNRATSLKKTLTYFLEAGLQNICMHVLDNASTDATPKVIQEFQKDWPRLKYHVNPYNIGGNANILRAFEISNSEYHWVIGDDDEWLLKPDLLFELAEVLKQNVVDLVRLGWLVSLESRGKSQSLQELITSESLFFSSVSMISATIIKRNTIAPYLPLAYQNIADSYPQLVSIIRGAEENLLNVYTLSQNLMIHTPSKKPGYFHGDLEWYAGWFRTSRYFTKLKLQKKFIREATYYMCRDKPGKVREFIWLLKVMLYFKSFNLSQTKYLFLLFIYGCGVRLQIFLLIFINCFTPIKFIAHLRKWYFKLWGLAQKSINVDRTRL